MRKLLILLALFAGHAVAQCGPAGQLITINGIKVCRPSPTPSFSSVAITATMPGGNTGSATFLGTVGARRLGPFHGFMQAAGENQSASGMVVGDSTGTDPKWVSIFASWIATQFPTCAVRYRSWNAGSLAYDAPTLLSAGSAGERYLNFDGSQTSSATITTDVIPFDGTVDVDYRIDLAPTSWASGGYQIPFRRWSGANKQFIVWLGPDAKMYYDYSGDGVSNEVASTVALPTSNTRMYIRVTHQRNDGAGHNVVKFYYSTDRGATWTQLGATITTAGAITAFDKPSATNVVYELGSFTTNVFSGKIYSAEIWQNGAPINPLRLETWRIVDTTHNTLGGSATLDILNASASGQDIAYHTTNFVAEMWPFGQSFFILNDSHNEVAKFGKSAWLDVVGTYLTSVKTTLPGAAIAVLTQNPRTVTSTWNWYHDERIRELRSWAPMNGYPVIDTYEAFLLDPRGLGVVLNADGIHPSIPEGVNLEATVVESVFLQSK